MKYLIVPESLCTVLFYGGIVLSLVSMFMVTKGILRKDEPRHLIKWCFILFVCVIIVALTKTGVVVANTMLGG